MPGAFVSVHLEAPAPNQLSICEAFVYTDQALPIERCPQFRDQPPGSTATYNGKCYVFYNRQPLMFRDALSFCRTRGGTLVDESNPALQGFISWELWRRHRSDASGQYWMGAVRDKSGGWNWLRGEEVTVSFWNLPVGNGECSRYDGAKGWLWSDTDCAMHLNYICQHQPKTCGRPEQPPNSTMLAPNFNVGTTIEYSCDEGHLLVGPTARQCLDTGFYNEFPPVCKRIQCGYPADIANGEYHLVNDSVGYLSRVMYNCNDGFEMVGRAQLACDIDERWNGPPPRCDAIQCEIPASIDNGFFETSNNETVYGTVITYTCKVDFKLLGPKELNCMPNGQYDAMPPMCEEELSSTPANILAKTSGGVSSTPTTTRFRSRPTRPPPTTIRAETEVVRLSHGTKNPTSTVAGLATVFNTEQYHPSTLLPPPPPPPPIVLAGHPQDNEIAGSSNVQAGESPNVNVPLSIDGVERREPYGAKLNMGAIIALGAFGGFVFLAAIITTIIILVRRNRSANTHYRHRASPDCNTVASFDSSSSESRHGGLNRYYRQAWENLHESAAVAAGNGGGGGGGGGSKKQSPGHHKDAMQQEQQHERHRDGSEMVVSDGVQQQQQHHHKKRHHHHHHHHGKEPRSGGAGVQYRGGEGASRGRY